MLNYIFPARDLSDSRSAGLSALEFHDLPWAPKRIYWLKDFKPGITRGNHAHKSLSQIFTVLRGAVTIELFQGTANVSTRMTIESGQLLVEPGTWRVIKDATEDAILLVLASSAYNEEDYIRDWNQYTKWYKDEYLSEA
jgi:dTDP-4-dehydrorhamnose 3,5-epimerase-like enzyme